jgi:pescadillo protein
VIRERYPTFIDALRDLDDALCLIFLFATFPVNNKINASVISECQRLSAEFQHYVMRARCLRKVFLSIKGIYYQAEIKGQPVTWLVPYQFVQTIPKDVDLQVMLSFLDFYRAFIGFVNYRLFSELGLVYPPKLDISKEAIGAGLDALRIVSKQPDWSQHTDAQTSKKVNLKEIRKSSEQRLKSLQSKMADIVDADMKQEEEQEKEEEEEEDVTMEADTFAEDKVAGEEGDVAKPSALVVHHTSVANLFANQIFFLSREVPRHSLEFVLKACGAQVGWDATQGGASPFTEQDNRITHHVCDRPDPGHAYFGRIYIQPQWVYDSINAGRLLDTTPYRPGATLPAHLSPFVQYEKGDYVPEEAREQFGVQVEESEPASEDEQDQEVSMHVHNRKPCLYLIGTTSNGIGSRSSWYTILRVSGKPTTNQQRTQSKGTTCCRTTTQTRSTKNGYHSHVQTTTSSLQASTTCYRAKRRQGKSYTSYIHTHI